ncbi:MAG TPA: CopD family protein [Rhizomicrobium sp.]|jgi:putative copper resistance protein D
MTGLFAITRALHFFSAMTLFGACAFALVLRSRLNCETGLPRSFFALCGAVALLTTLLTIGFVADQMTGTAAAIFDPAQWGGVAGNTLYGELALVRAALFMMFLLCVWLRPEWTLRAGVILGGAALILLGPTSHASRSVASQYVLLLAANDSVHLLAGGFWLGGLVALLPATLAKPRDIPEWLTRLRLFSAWGMAAVGVLILAGSANAIAILDIQGMRWSETYLDWLAIKLVLAAVMIALALTNRFGLMPAIARGDKEAGETLPWTLFAELSCAGLILLAVGILGLTAPMQM